MPEERCNDVTAIRRLGSVQESYYQLTRTCTNVCDALKHNVMFCELLSDLFINFMDSQVYEVFVK